MNRLLMDEPPLLVLPSLAQAVGLNEALFLQQLHWMLGRDSAQVQDDQRWVRSSAENFQRQFPFWSVRTVERIISDLKKAELILVKRTRGENMYSLNPDALRQIGGPQTATLTPTDRQVDGPPCKREGEREETLFGDAGAPLPPKQETPDYIQDVWTLYVELFGSKLRIKDLTERRRKMIERAFKAAGGTTDEPESAVSVLKDAVRGLSEYRKAHPDRSQNTDLSVIFETGPQSRSNLTDQIEWWAKQAEEIGKGEETMTPLLRNRMSRRKTAVVQMIRQPQNRAIQQDGREALEWLREHGVDVVVHPPEREGDPERIEWTAVQ